MTILCPNIPRQKVVSTALTTWLIVQATFLISLADTSLLQDKEKAQVRIGLNYFKIANDSSYLTVRVLTRQDRQYVPVPGVIINLFLNEETRSGMMGNITTDENGQGTFILPPKFYDASDTLTSLEFFARLKNDPNYEDKTTTLEIKDAEMAVSFDALGDSLKQITVKLMERDSAGQQIPVESADIKFYVKRLFGLLPVGEDNNFTDEQGEVTINFPNDLGGGSQGDLEVIIKLEDDDDFGNIIVSKTLPWGTKLLTNREKFDQRNMWSARDKTPYYMLIWPNLILLAVWGVIFYLILQLVKINKIGKKI